MRVEFGPDQADNARDQMVLRSASGFSLLTWADLWRNEHTFSQMNSGPSQQVHYFCQSKCSCPALWTLRNTLPFHRKGAYQPFLPPNNLVEVPLSVSSLEEGNTDFILLGTNISVQISKITELPFETQPKGILTFWSIARDPPGQRGRESCWPTYEVGVCLDWTLIPPPLSLLPPAAQLPSPNWASPRLSPGTHLQWKCSCVRVTPSGPGFLANVTDPNILPALI